MIADITAQVVQNYSRYLKKEKQLGETSVGMFMARLRVIVNYAKRMYSIKYDVEPFEFYSIPKSSERELDLSVEDVRKIRDFETAYKGEMTARDTFMLSYYLGGINLVDMLEIDFRNAEQIDYVRTKSRNTKRGDKRISLTIPEEAKPIIQRWMNKKTGKLDFGYKFSYDNFSCFNNGRIKRMAKKLGITSRVCYYSARKSFVQHGFELGVPLEVLEYSTIVAYILWLNKYVRILGIGYDPWKSTEVINMLSASGAGSVIRGVRQTYGTFTAPVESFEHGAKTGKIHINNNPINAYCFGNAILDSDKLENCKPIKRSDTNKIDGVITMLMCLRLFMDYER